MWCCVGQCWIQFVLSLVLFFFFIWGICSAVSYAKIHNLRKNHNNTTCQTLNYTSFTHTCQDCSQDCCFYYKCYDITILATYPISNKTLITGVFTSFNSGNQYEQSQVIIIKLCFYFL